MTDFPQLKMKALVNFPAQAYGRVGITVSQLSGAFYIDTDYSKFSAPPLPVDVTPFYFLLWNSVANTYQLCSFVASPFAPLNNPVFTGDPQAPTAAPGDNDQSIATTAFVTGAITVNNGISRAVTTGGPVTIAPNDRVVAIYKTTGAPTVVTLPLAASKNGPVIISDFKRDGATNNITINPSGAELIQGLPSLTLAANGASAQLFPIPGVGYAL
jgi:hypothetical protein